MIYFMEIRLDRMRAELDFGETKDMGAKEMQIIELQYILILIEKNNYSFPKNKDRVEFDTLCNEYNNELSFKYKLIYNQFIAKKPAATLPPLQFTKTLSKTQQNYLFKQLTESDVFLSKSSTDYDSFCFVFGNSKEPEKFIPLVWQPNSKQFLRDLIEPLKHPDIKKADLERVIPNLFIDIKGKPIILPKNKVLKNRPEYKKIMKFLATL